MASRSSFRLAPPSRVYDKYMSMRNGTIMADKILSDDAIAEFQQSLNDAQPQTDEDAMSRSLIQYLYRKNPINFCRFLERSKLNHLVLWTEAKCIVSHFNLRGAVYIKWVDDHYECSLHSNFNAGVSEHPALQGAVDSVSGRRHEFPNKQRRGGGVRTMLRRRVSNETQTPHTSPANAYKPSPAVDLSQSVTLDASQCL